MTETTGGDGHPYPTAPPPRVDPDDDGMVVELNGAMTDEFEVDRGYFQGGWEFAENSDGTWMLRFIDIDVSGREQAVFAYLVEDPHTVVELRDALGEVYEAMTDQAPPEAVGAPSRGGLLGRLRRDGRMALASSPAMRVAAVLIVTVLAVLLFVAIFRNAFS